MFHLLQEMFQIKFTRPEMKTETFVTMGFKYPLGEECKFQKYQHLLCKDNLYVIFWYDIKMITNEEFKRPMIVENFSIYKRNVNNIFKQDDCDYVLLLTELNQSYNRDWLTLAQQKFKKEYPEVAKREVEYLKAYKEKEQYEALDTIETVLISILKKDQSQIKRENFSYIYSSGTSWISYVPPVYELINHHKKKTEQKQFYLDFLSSEKCKEILGKNNE